MEHIKKPGYRNPYACSVCYSTFPTTKLLERHVEHEHDFEDESLENDFENNEVVRNNEICQSQNNETQVKIGLKIQDIRWVKIIWTASKKWILVSKEYKI